MNKHTQVVSSERRTWVVIAIGLLSDKKFYVLQSHENVCGKCKMVNFRFSICSDIPSAAFNVPL